MSENASLSLPAAAHRLGIPLRVLRHAIRIGRLPTPPDVSATSSLPAEWFDRAQAAVEASPAILNRSFQQKVPPFARYEGTSAWRKYPDRVRAYNRFRAAVTAPG